MVVSKPIVNFVFCVQRLRVCSLADDQSNKDFEYTEKKHYQFQTSIVSEKTRVFGGNARFTNTLNWLFFCQ